MLYVTTGRTCTVGSTAVLPENFKGILHTYTILVFRHNLLNIVPRFCFLAAFCGFPSVPLIPRLVGLRMYELMQMTADGRFLLIC